MSDRWDLQQAAELCQRVEAVCVPFGCHVALTGGVLYKDGARKDLDLLFYRIRQVDKIDRAGLFKALRGVGLVKLKGWGWCYKAIAMGKPVDLFFPDEVWSRPPEPWHAKAARWVRRNLLRASA